MSQEYIGRHIYGDCQCQEHEVC